MHTIGMQFQYIYTTIYHIYILVVYTTSNVAACNFLLYFSFCVNVEMIDAVVTYENTREERPAVFPIVFNVIETMVIYYKNPIFFDSLSQYFLIFAP